MSQQSIQDLITSQLLSTSSNSTKRWWVVPYFNQTSFNFDVNELSSNLHHASNVDVNRVLTSTVFNAVIFFLYAFIWNLALMFPNVYASKQSRETMIEATARTWIEGEQREDDAHYNDDDYNDDYNDSEKKQMKKRSKRDEESILISSLARHKLIAPFESNNANNDKRQVSEGDIILHDIKKEWNKYVYKSEIPFRWITCCCRSIVIIIFVP